MFGWETKLTRDETGAQTTILSQPPGSNQLSEWGRSVLPSPIATIGFLGRCEARLYP
jgi:hypothetical protein